MAVLSAPEEQVCRAALRALYPPAAYPVENAKVRACIAYLTILTADPPAGFVAGVHDVSCDFRPGSKGKLKVGNAFVSIVKIEWVDPDHAIVDGSSVAAISSSESMGHGWQVDITRSESGWAAGRLRITWIT